MVETFRRDPARRSNPMQNSLFVNCKWDCFAAASSSGCALRTLRELCAARAARNDGTKGIFETAFARKVAV